MKFGQMINTLRIHCKVEIRNENNFQICVCNTDSDGVAPYIDMEVVEWFVFASAALLSASFCVLVDTSGGVTHESEDKEENK